jgi:hypothetical protein
MATSTLSAKPSRISSRVTAALESRSCQDATILAAITDGLGKM